MIRHSTEFVLSYKLTTPPIVNIDIDSVCSGYICLSLWWDLVDFDCESSSTNKGLNAMATHGIAWRPPLLDVCRKKVNND